MHTLREYLQNQNKNIKAINGFRTDEEGELIPCLYNEKHHITDDYTITPWSITFYDTAREPVTRFKFEGSELSDIDMLLNDKEKAMWEAEFDDIQAPKKYEEEDI